LSCSTSAAALIGLLKKYVAPICERALMVSIEVTPLTTMIGMVDPKRLRSFWATISPLMSGR